MASLGQALLPCGPNPDVKASDRLLAVIASKEIDDFAGIETAWSALAPAFGASPYLAGLARRDPNGLAALLRRDPDLSFEDILHRARATAREPLTVGASTLRRLKAQTHLLTALCDLGAIWTLDQVTDAMAQFADAALQSALHLAAQAEVDAGRLTRLGEDAEGPVPGLFCIAMGKHGAFELNYSSDIDISVFFEPDRMPVAIGEDVQAVAVRLTNRLSLIMQERTAEGYVFRVDLRLRPDPSSTPLAVSVPAALEYYGSVGQNWERAAYIKARACAGDLSCAQAFLRDLTAFVWRKNLDFEAIADIHAIKRQIHVHKVDDRLTAKGVDVKLGRGGIREIEFYVQTQQLILGGRNPSLRSRRTLDALQALTLAGHITPAACEDMTKAYKRLRAIEHRIQMLADEQTHKLPESDADRRRIAALMGQGRLASFDALVERTLKAVNGRYGELFPDEEPLSSKFGSLIFTGVDDDPETLKTLAKIGMVNPAWCPKPFVVGIMAISPPPGPSGGENCLQGWHHACWMQPRPQARPTWRSNALPISSVDCRLGFSSRLCSWPTPNCLNWWCRSWPSRPDLPRPWRGVRRPWMPCWTGIFLHPLTVRMIRKRLGLRWRRLMASKRPWMSPAGFIGNRPSA